MKHKLLFLLLAATLMSIMAFRHTPMADTLTGAWQLKTADLEHVLLFIDGYYTHTTYNVSTKRFAQTRGGTYTVDNNKLTVHYEFDTQQKERIGQTVTYKAAVSNGQLAADLDGNSRQWRRLDDGQAPLAGLWQITARQQNGQLQAIHQTGTRKTVKILTGTRFQWAAIDPGTQQFMGTGGGTYTFKEGKYTEQIEFFSRDSSRVGSSLTFNGRLENGNWHHSGHSSKGDPIYEVWSRQK